MVQNRWLLMLLAATLLGCRGESPPKAAPVAPAKQTATEASPPEPAAPPVEVPTAPTGEVPSESAPVAAVESPPATYGVERFVIFAPLNPLIVELRLTIDGQPHEAALEQLVDRALRLADADGDGRVMWDELTASPRFKYGQFGNLPIDGENGPKQIVERYDIDRDGVVDRNELPRFLTRNAGGSRPFSIRGMIDDSPSGRRESPLWQLLDVDGNSRLSADEIAAAPDRLQARDADDDEILATAELMPPSTAMLGAMPQTRRRGGREAARLLGPQAQWDNVRTALEERYALGGNLGAEDFPLSPKLFALLDENGDGRIRRREIERLNLAPPDLILAVRLQTTKTTPEEGASVLTADAVAEADGGDESQAAADVVAAPDETLPRLEFIAFGDELLGEKLATPLPGDRLLVEAAGASLIVYLNDTLAAADYAQQAERLLAMYDGNQDGYLDASEIDGRARSAIGRIEAVDTDGDGKAYAGDIAGFLATQQQVLRSQVHARVEGKPDPLRETLDRNDDGRLDSREIDGAAARIQSLDANGDGEIDLDELPTGLLLGIARGSLETPDALFTMPPAAVPAPAANAPRWFLQTDANRDGLISPREFLGPAELFERLDANGDGFLTADEATGP